MLLCVCVCVFAPSFSSSHLSTVYLVFVYSRKNEEKSTAIINREWQTCCHETIKETSAFDV